VHRQIIIKFYYINELYIFTAAKQDDQKTDGPVEIFCIIFMTNGKKWAEKRTREEE